MTDVKTDVKKSGHPLFLLFTAAPTRSQSEVDNIHILFLRPIAEPYQRGQLRAKFLVLRLFHCFFHIGYEPGQRTRRNYRDAVIIQAPSLFGKRYFICIESAQKQRLVYHDAVVQANDFFAAFK